MSNVYDMRRRKTDTINEMVDEVHRQFDQALTSDKRAHSSRLYAGHLLNRLQERVEQGEEGSEWCDNWWGWYATRFVRSRKDAEKVMAMADSDDPEGALEEERDENRNAVSRLRKREKEFPVEALKRKIGKLTDEQRHELSAWFRSEYGL